jgi:hypothetical protein
MVPTGVGGGNRPGRSNSDREDLPVVDDGRPPYVGSVTRVSSGVDRTSLLVDESAAAAFRADGFTVVPFLEPDRLASLRERILPLVPEDSGPFFSLYRNDDPEIRRRLDVAVRAELTDAAAGVLRDHRIFLGSLLVKFPGDASYLAPHQDWSFVDEERYASGILWFPLQATDDTNGGMCVVPGSHRMDLPDRGAPLDYPIEEYLDGLVQVTTQPGEALVMHNALIHGSRENRSSEPRVVMVLGFASVDADLLHYFTDEDGQKWRYRVRPEFFFDHRPPGRPSGSGVVSVEPWESIGVETVSRTEVHLAPTEQVGRN